MTDKRIRHLPVMDGDKLRGVISIGDLVKCVISASSATIAHLENYISGGYAELMSVAAVSDRQRLSNMRRLDRRYSFQTVFPPTIVRTARPFSFQPSNGVLRESALKRFASTVHSSSGSIKRDIRGRARR